MKKILLILALLAVLLATGCCDKIEVQAEIIGMEYTEAWVESGIKYDVNLDTYVPYTDRHPARYEIVLRYPNDKVRTHRVGKAIYYTMEVGDPYTVMICDPNPKRKR